MKKEIRLVRIKNRENGVMGVPTYVINDGITLTG